MREPPGLAVPSTPLQVLARNLKRWPWQVHLFSADRQSIPEPHCLASCPSVDITNNLRGRTQPAIVFVKYPLSVRLPRRILNNAGSRSWPFRASRELPHDWTTCLVRTAFCSLLGNDIARRVRNSALKNRCDGQRTQARTSG